MKFFVIVLFAAACLCTLNTPCFGTYESQEKIKGGFKKCTGYSYKSKFGEIDIKSKYKSSTAQYNESGNIVEEIAYSEKGKVVSKYTYKYDPYGNNIERILSESKDAYKALFKYDEKGNRTEGIWYKPNGKVDFTVKYLYNDKGKCIEELYASGKTEIKTVYKYDGKGNNISEDDYMASGTVFPKTTIEYDEKGNKVEEMLYKTNGDERLEIKYRHDGLGNILERGHYYQGTFISKSLYKYDEFNNKTEEVSYNDNDQATQKTEFIFQTN